MLKKYMIFGSVALLLAALLALTGCSQATDSDGGSQSYSLNYLYGDSNETDVRIAVQAAKSGGRSVVLGENLRLTSSGVPLATAGAAVADFETMSVLVEQNVSVTNVIVNAAYASLSFAPGASITLGPGAVFIYSGEPDDKTLVIAGGAKVKYVSNPLYGTQGTDQGIAVDDYVIMRDFSDIHPAITNLYVLKTLTIDAGSTAAPGNGTTPGTPRIFALGEVDLAASNTLVFQNLANFQFTTSAVLTSKVPGVILTLPAGLVDLPAIEAAVPIIIAGPSANDIGDMTIAEVRGPDTVTISPATGRSMGSLTVTRVSESGNLDVVSPAAIAGISINNNAGSISLAAASFTGGISGNPGANPGLNNTGTISIKLPAGTPLAQGATVRSNAGVIEFDIPGASALVNIKQNTETGEVIFKQSLTTLTGANILQAPANNGRILFQGGLTTTGALGDGIPANAARNIAGRGTIEFTGAVDFGGATNIDCNMVFNRGLTTANPLNLGGDVTLANGREITLTNIAAVTTLKGGKKLLVGNEAVLAGGAAGAVITPVANAALTAGTPDPDDDDSVEYKTLTLDTAGIAISNGELRILGTGVLEIAQGITIDAPGALTLETDAILQAIAGGIVTMGNTTITGSGAAGVGTRLSALDGEVKLTQNTITGSGSTLQVPEETSGPAIAVAGGILYLKGANLDLQFEGSLTIGNTNSVVLESGTNPGKITLGEDNIPFTGSLDGLRIDSDNAASLDGTGALLGSDAEELPSTIGQLSGTQKGRLHITGSGGIGNSSRIAAGLSVDE